MYHLFILSWVSAPLAHTYCIVDFYLFPCVTHTHTIAISFSFFFEIRFRKPVLPSSCAPCEDLNLSQVAIKYSESLTKDVLFVALVS